MYSITKFMDRINNAHDQFENSLIHNVLPYRLAGDLLTNIDEGQKYLAMNIYENDSSYIFRIDIPGFKKENIKIEMRDGLMQISGTRQMNRNKDTKAHYHEEETASFSKSFSLPADAKRDNPQAKYEDGVLEITLSKSEETKPKIINIH